MYIFQQISNLKNGHLRFILLTISLIITALVYLPGISGGFTHDDYPNIINNTKLHIDSLDISSLASASHSVKSGPLMRPVSMFSFAINYYALGRDPKSYKIINLLIHIFVGLLLFFFSRLLLDSYKKIHNQELDQSIVFWLPIVTTLAWLVSPINLTSVLYIVQRMTSLSALFSVAGLCFYVIARRSMIFKNKNNYYYFALSAVSFLTAILAKENGALNLLYLLCIEFCFFRFISNSTLSTPIFRTLFLSATLAPILFAVFWIASNSTYLDAGYSHRDYTLAERTMTEARLIVSYFKWIIVPNISELGLFHDDIAISKSLFSPLTTIISISLILIVFIFSILNIKTKIFLSFGLLFYFSSHVLESTIIPLELAYEHRNYLASYGVIFGILTSIFIYVKKSSEMKIAACVVIIWLCAISATTTLRSYHWGNDARHAYFEAVHHPKSGRAIFNLGRIYANLSAKNLIAESEYALNLFEEFIKLSPNKIIGESSAIVFSSAMNMEIKPEWLESMSKKLESKPITHNTIESLIQINSCLSKSCKLSLDQVFKLYIVALNNNIPSTSKSRSDLLTLYAVFSSYHLGDRTVAYNAMIDAVNNKPDFLQYRINLITLLIEMEKFDEAAFHLKYVDKHDKVNSFAIETDILRKKLKQ